MIGYIIINRDLTVSQSIQYAGKVLEILPDVEKLEIVIDESFIIDFTNIGVFKETLNSVIPTEVVLITDCQLITEVTVNVGSIIVKLKDSQDKEYKKYSNLFWKNADDKNIIVITEPDNSIIHIPIN